jgi:NTE family protein
VFDNNEVSVTRVLASACLPFLSQAVKIDGEYFWDGGYMRNPALFPQIYNCESRDIIVIHINPTESLEIPQIPLPSGLLARSARHSLGTRLHAI